MIVVADASVLVGELLRRRGRELLLDPDLRLLVAEHQWEEAEHELSRRLSILESQRRFTAEQRIALQQSIGDLVEARAIEVVPRDTYASLEHVATERVPRDQRDWPTVALAMVLDAGILTGDNDFLGCGCPTWTVETLRAELRRRGSRLPWLATASRALSAARRKSDRIGRQELCRRSRISVVMARLTPRIVLSVEERCELEHVAACYTRSHKEVQRAKLVLYAAAGEPNVEIGRRLDMNPEVVGRWRKRFAEQRLEGLMDRPRAGRPRRFPPGRGRTGQGGRVRAATPARHPALAVQ